MADFIVRKGIPPAAEQNADPFERQGSDSGMMLFASPQLLIVICLGPFRFHDGVGGPFVERLP